MTDVKSFFSSFGSKIKTFVNEEQKVITSFFNEGQPTKETIKPDESILPPWLDIQTDDPKIFAEVKTQILNLTQTKRNFLNAPPDDINFPFNFEEYLPIATLALKTDPALANARFYLVPKYIREPQFWHNYFWRVHLIKEAYGLHTLKRLTHTQTEGNLPKPQLIDTVQKTPSRDIPERSSRDPSKEDDLLSRPRSTTTEEFISDSFSDATVNMRHLQNELGQLGISPATEAAIRRELESSISASPSNPGTTESFELDEAWEQQLMKELGTDLRDQ